jgi:hypothetical protein
LLNINIDSLGRLLKLASLGLGACQLSSQTRFLPIESSDSCVFGQRINRMAQLREPDVTGLHIQK